MNDAKTQALTDLAAKMGFTPEEAVYLPSAVATIAKVMGRVEANIIYNLNTNRDFRSYVTKQIRTLVFEKGVEEGMKAFNEGGQG